MLDPLAQMSRNFLYLTKKFPAPSFNPETALCGSAIALTLAFVTCYFQWS